MLSVSLSANPASANVGFPSWSTDLGLRKFTWAAEKPPPASLLRPELVSLFQFLQFFFPLPPNFADLLILHVVGLQQMWNECQKPK